MNRIFMGEAPLNESPEGNSDFSLRRLTILRFGARGARRLNTIDVAPAATVEGRWQIGKLLSNSIGGYVEAISRDGSVAWTVIRPRSGRATKEVDAVAYECGDVVCSADYPNGEIGNVVIGAAA